MTHWFAVSWLRTWARSQSGQTMAEYAVILAVIAVGVIIAITALSGGIGDAIDKVTGALGGG